MQTDEYKTEREKRGTQTGVALALGVHWRTIQDRENGRIPITEEARRALLSVPLRKKKRAPRRPNDKTTDQLDCRIFTQKKN